jgi:queuine tRNA-ribosyltransferase
MKFSVTYRDGAARRGTLELAHGRVDTPAFMPVGTYGTVKAMSPEELTALGAQIVLGNTFHLWLRPGLEVIAKHQGLHRFMGWNGPILTDSGGFQVFSLGALRKISEDGVRFASPINGDRLLLTPEESMRIQLTLDSDIAMAFDECTAYPATEQEAAASMRLSMRWARRSKSAFESSNALFGIVQGGMYESLRAESLEELKAMAFDGYAIGGLAVGEPEEERSRILGHLVPRMPQERPRYLMGMGTPEDLIGAVNAGIDMMDCVLPTRNARNGWLFTRHGGRHPHPQRALPRRSCAARRAVRMLRLQELYAGLPLPPAEGERDPRRPAEYPPQPALLPGAHARAAGRDRAGDAFAQDQTTAGRAQAAIIPRFHLGAGF